MWQILQRSYRSKGCFGLMFEEVSVYDFMILLLWVCGNILHIWWLYSKQLESKKKGIDGSHIHSGICLQWSEFCPLESISCRLLIPLLHRFDTRHSTHKYLSHTSISVLINEIRGMKFLGKSMYRFNLLYCRHFFSACTCNVSWYNPQKFTRDHLYCRYFLNDLACSMSWYNPYKFTKDSQSKHKVSAFLFSKGTRNQSRFSWSSYSMV